MDNSKQVLKYIMILQAMYVLIESQICQWYLASLRQSVVFFLENESSSCQLPETHTAEISKCHWTSQARTYPALMKFYPHFVRILSICAGQTNMSWWCLWPTCLQRRTWRLAKVALKLGQFFKVGIQITLRSCNQRKRSNNHICDDTTENRGLNVHSWYCCE